MPSERTDSTDSLPLQLQNVCFEPRGTMTWVLWLVVLTIVTSFMGIFMAARFEEYRELSTLCGRTFVASVVAALVVAAIRETRFPIGKTMQVEQGGLRVKSSIGGSFMFAAKGFVEGWHSPEARRVCLRRRDGNIVSAGVSDADAASTVLQRVGVDASKRTMRMRLGSVGFLNAVVWLLGPIFAVHLGEAIGNRVGIPGALSLPIAAVIFLIEFLLVQTLFGPEHLVLGADGIIVEKRSGRRFVPYKNLQSITTTDSRVTLRLNNGKKVRAKARHLGDEEQDIIKQRVRDALALRDERSADLAAFAALDRGQRDIKAWGEALQGVFSKGGGYRQAKLTLEQVAAVLVDPVAPVDRRIGAAMVLSQSGDGDAKSKIRAAIDSSVNRKVRVALEAIERGDLENAAIEEAATDEAANVVASGAPKR